MTLKGKATLVNAESPFKNISSLQVVLLINNIIRNAKTLPGSFKYLEDWSGPDRLDYVGSRICSVTAPSESHLSQLWSGQAMVPFPIAMNLNSRSMFGHVQTFYALYILWLTVGCFFHNCEVDLLMTLRVNYKVVLNVTFKSQIQTLTTFIQFCYTTFWRKEVV